MRIALTVLAAFALVWTVQYTLRLAPLRAAGPPLPQALSAFRDDPPVRDREDWLGRRAPLLRAAFENLLYGAPPATTAPRVVSRRLIADDAFGGLGRIEQLNLRVSGGHAEAAFSLLLITPVRARAPTPAIIVPNFCGNRAALGGVYQTVAAPSWTAPRCRTAATRSLTRALHGANIVQPPFAELLRAGYTIATYSPSEVAPDDSVLGPRALARFSNPGSVGAIGVWAWSMSRVVDQLAREPNIDANRIAVFGHSRFGKAALWAAAKDTRIALVVANQSGRLGAAPSASPTGETLAHLYRSFPYWFPPMRENAQAQPPLDQHLLLALIAPRPILLGGARLDRWSDPAGAFEAAQAATPVYRLFGRVGLDQPDMTTTNFNADIAVFLRSGGHGVRPEDWRQALAFLNAHFQGQPAR